MAEATAAAGVPVRARLKERGTSPKMRCSSFRIVASNFVTAARRRQAYYPVNRRAGQAHDLLSRMRLAERNMSEENSDLRPNSGNSEKRNNDATGEATLDPVGTGAGGQMSVAECRSGLGICQNLG